MSSRSKRGKETVVSGDDHDDQEDEGLRSNEGGESSSSSTDWREEMRQEMRQEIRAVLAERLNEAPLQLPLGPSEIDAADVIDSAQYAEMMRKIDANNSSNKTALRLANVTKEGNKQHFMDMVEIREEVEKAAFSLKESTERLSLQSI